MTIAEQSQTRGERRGLLSLLFLEENRSSLVTEMVSDAQVRTAFDISIPLWHVPHLSKGSG
jgi:hypothetical protein